MFAVENGKLFKVKVKVSLFDWLMINGCNTQSEYVVSKVQITAKTNDWKAY